MSDILIMGGYLEESLSSVSIPKWAENFFTDLKKNDGKIEFDTMGEYTRDTLGFIGALNLTLKHQGLEIHARNGFYELGLESGIQVLKNIANSVGDVLSNRIDYIHGTIDGETFSSLEGFKERLIQIIGTTILNKNIGAGEQVLIPEGKKQELLNKIDSFGSSETILNKLDTKNANIIFSKGSKTRKIYEFFYDKGFDVSVNIGDIFDSIEGLDQISPFIKKINLNLEEKGYAQKIVTSGKRSYWQLVKIGSEIEVIEPGEHFGINTLISFVDHSGIFKSGSAPKKIYLFGSKAENIGKIFSSKQLQKIGGSTTPLSATIKTINNKLKNIGSLQKFEDAGYGKYKFVTGEESNDKVSEEKNDTKKKEPITIYTFRNSKNILENQIHVLNGKTKLLLNEAKILDYFDKSNKEQIFLHEFVDETGMSWDEVNQASKSLLKKQEGGIDIGGEIKDCVLSIRFTKYNRINKKSKFGEDIRNSLPKREAVPEGNNVIIEDGPDGEEVSVLMRDHSGDFIEGTAPYKLYKFGFENVGIEYTSAKLGEVSLSSNATVTIQDTNKKLTKLGATQRFEKVRRGVYKFILGDEVIVKTNSQSLDIGDSPEETRIAKKFLEGEKFRIPKSYLENTNNPIKFDYEKLMVDNVELDRDEFLLCIIADQKGVKFEYTDIQRKCFTEGTILTDIDIISLKSQATKKLEEKKSKCKIEMREGTYCFETGENIISPKKLIEFFKNQRGQILVVTEVISRNKLSTLEKFKTFYGIINSEAYKKYLDINCKLYRLGGRFDWAEVFYGTDKELKHILENKKRRVAENILPDKSSSSEGKLTGYNSTERDSLNVESTKLTNPHNLPFTTDELIGVIEENPDVKIDLDNLNLQGMKFGDTVFSVYLILLIQRGEKLTVSEIGKKLSDRIKIDYEEKKEELEIQILGAITNLIEGFIENKQSGCIFEEDGKYYIEQSSFISEIVGTEDGGEEKKDDTVVIDPKIRDEKISEELIKNSDSLKDVSLSLDILTQAKANLNETKLLSNEEGFFLGDIELTKSEFIFGGLLIAHRGGVVDVSTVKQLTGQDISYEELLLAKAGIENKISKAYPNLKILVNSEEKNFSIRLNEKADDEKGYVIQGVEFHISKTKKYIKINGILNENISTKKVFDYFYELFFSSSLSRAYNAGQNIEFVRTLNKALEDTVLYISASTINKQAKLVNRHDKDAVLVKEKMGKINEKKHDTVNPIDKNQPFREHILSQDHNFIDSINTSELGIAITSGKNIMFGSYGNIQLNEIEFIIYTLLLSKINTPLNMRDICDELIISEDEISSVEFAKYIKGIISQINAKIPQIKNRESNKVFKISQKNELYNIESPLLEYKYQGEIFTYQSVNQTLKIGNRKYISGIDKNIIDYIIRLVSNKEKQFLEIDIKKDGGLEQKRTQLNTLFQSKQLPFFVQSNSRMYYKKAS